MCVYTYIYMCMCYYPLECHASPRHPTHHRRLPCESRGTASPGVHFFVGYRHTHMIYFGTLLIAGFANICVTRIPISLIKSWWLDRVRGGVPHVVHKACPASNTKSHTRHTCNNLEWPGLLPVAFFSWYAVAGIFSCKVFPSKCALISFIIFSAAFHVTSWLMTSNTRSFASDAMSTPSSASFSSTASSCVVPPVCTSGGTMCIFLSTRLPRGTPCCSLCLYRVLALNLITLGSELMHLLQPQGATSLPNPMFCGPQLPFLKCGHTTPGQEPNGGCLFSESSGR